MPAITVEDTLVLPRLSTPDPASRPRPVAKVITARREAEGAGFVVARPFPGELSLTEADPFLLLDHVGPLVNAPGEAKGAPWHPHRGIETVSYILDGEIAHHDSNGGGGVIAEGDTQWMTAGGGILHDELPSERAYRIGGPFHAVQLWVNLPPALKLTAPRYQAITRDGLRLLTTPDGGALVRLIAGTLGGFEGPGVTHTPIIYAHVTLAPGAQLSVPWSPDFSAFAYVLTGRAGAGHDHRPIDADQLAVFGPGGHVVLTAEDQAEPLELLVFGGLPIRAPIVHYGPFVMNTRAEILQAIDDYQAGRLGTIPADQLAPASSHEAHPERPMSATCTHLDQVADVTPSSDGCEDCLRIGGQWVHLRMCMSCGHVGCCDNSPHRHATAHFHGTDHPLIQSYEPGEDWWYCYVDDLAFVVDSAPSFEHP